MESSGPSTAAPEFDVYGAMDWKDGVGTLPGSELKVREHILNSLKSAFSLYSSYIVI